MNRRRFLSVSLISGVCSSQTIVMSQGDARKKVLPIPGNVFQCDGREAFLIAPPMTDTKVPSPWVWYAPTLKPYPGPEERWMIDRFLEAGVAIAGIDVGESYGSPVGVSHYEAFYREMTERRGYQKRPALLARSRGGLMLYSWASRHPDNVSCIAGIYPVCDYTSWPGAEKAAPAYGLRPEELVSRAMDFNPIERLAPLAGAGVPIFHIHGDSDSVVPLERNSGKLAERYRKLGGSMTLVVPEGQGHSMWKGFFECQPLVDFVIRNVTKPENPEPEPRSPG